MSKKLATALILALVVSLVAAPMVMAEESDQKEEEETYTLDELVVIASKHPEKLSETPVSVEKIDEEDIAKKNAQNVADLLRDVSGINISDYGGAAGGKTISVRGSKANEILILVDGQLMNDPQGKKVDLGQLPIDQIEEIEILKGPSSAIYGADALGGVVNITTKSGSEKPRTNVTINLGSFRTRKLNLSHRGSAKNLDYNLAVTKKKTDGYKENSAVDLENIFTKFNYQLTNHSDLILSLQSNDFINEYVAENSGAEMNNEDTTVNLQWKKKTGNLDQKLGVYHGEYKYSTTTGTESKPKRKGIDFNQTLYYQNNTLTYGFDLKEDEIQYNSDDGDRDIDKTNESYFIQDEWEFNEVTKINIGGRYDKYKQEDSTSTLRDGSEFSPRMGIVYSINPRFNLRFSAAEAYKTPSFDDLYSPKRETNVGSDDFWNQHPENEPYTSITEGDPDLDPQSAKAYEMGIRYLSNDMRGEFNLFRRNIEDLIEWEDIWNEDKTVLTYRPENTGTAKIKGAEIILDKELTPNYSMNFNYTYLDAKDDEGEQLDSKPYHTANIGLDYSYQDTIITLNGKLVGERKDGTSNLPSYFVTDLKLTEQLKDSAKVSLEINNLLDREYENKANYPMPGRNFMLELSREF